MPRAPFKNIDDPRILVMLINRWELVAADNRSTPKQQIEALKHIERLKGLPNVDLEDEDLSGLDGEDLPEESAPTDEPISTPPAPVSDTLSSDDESGSKVGNRSGNFFDDL